MLIVSLAPGGNQAGLWLYGIDIFMMVRMQDINHPVFGIRLCMPSEDFELNYCWTASPYPLSRSASL